MCCTISCRAGAANPRQKGEVMQMICVDNYTYKDCLTVGKLYDVTPINDSYGETMYCLKDDNGEQLNTLLHRFTPLEGE